jgi:hypothetical protein
MFNNRNKLTKQQIENALNGPVSFSAEGNDFDTMRYKKFVAYWRKYSALPTEARNFQHTMLVAELFTSGDVMNFAVRLSKTPSTEQYQGVLKEEEKQEALLRLRAILLSKRPMSKTMPIKDIVAFLDDKYTDRFETEEFIDFVYRCYTFAQSRQQDRGVFQAQFEAFIQQYSDASTIGATSVAKEKAQQTHMSVEGWKLIRLGCHELMTRAIQQTDEESVGSRKSVPRELFTVSGRKKFNGVVERMGCPRELLPFVREK